MNLLHASWVASAALFMIAQAHAVDGVVLIDQNKALAGNVTPGDTAGFPILINQPGSYRLSGNLTVPAGVNGIQIASDDVTLDLNGFRIAGSPTAKAITDSGSHYQRASISNGVLTGFGEGIRLQISSHVTVRDVRSTGALSIVVGSHSLIQRNIAEGLIQFVCPSVASENVTDGYITSFAPITGEQCIRWNNRAINFNSAINQ